MLRRLCVFCGSSPGKRPVYTEAAERLGATLVARGIELVYGGGKVGLMGVLADAVLQRGGGVIGVIPESLRAREVAHDALPDLRVVDSMHARKALMADLSDAFVALPGGLGTFEELFEITTWGQLGLHIKPVGLLDVAGYFTPLRAMLERAVEERFVRPEHRDLLIVRNRPEALLDALGAYRATAAPEKWMGRDQR